MWPFSRKSLAERSVWNKNDLTHYSLVDWFEFPDSTDLKLIICRHFRDGSTNVVEIVRNKDLWFFADFSDLSNGPLRENIPRFLQLIEWQRKYGRNSIAPVERLGAIRIAKGMSVPNPNNTVEDNDPT